MMMMVKLCVILGLMGVVAVVLTRLFPADKEADAPRTLNDLMREVDLDEEPDAVEFAEDEAEAGADESEAEDAAEEAQTAED